MEYTLRKVDDDKVSKPYSELVNENGVIVWSENESETALDRVMYNFVSTQDSEVMVKMLLWQMQCMGEELDVSNVENISLTFESTVNGKRKKLCLDFCINEPSIESDEDTESCTE